jgi:hypothetical protein
MAIQIQHRRDTATNWSSTNPVLGQGELGYDLTNKIYKIGDGSTAWNSLPQATVFVTSPNEWTSHQYFDEVSLTISGSGAAWDLATGQMTQLTMTTDVTLANPTNKPDGRAVYHLLVKQDGTGGHTLSFGTDYLFPGGTVPSITSTASGIDLLSFLYDSDSDKMLGTSALDYS